VTPLILIAASLGAAIIHFAFGPEHLEELGALGLGFYISGALQVGWALLALVASRISTRSWLTRAVVPTGIVLNVAILVAWAVSRTVGLPAGEQPWTPEPIGIADGICGLLEAGIVVGLLAYRSRWQHPVVPRPGRRTSTSLLGLAAMVAVIAVATVTAVNAHEGHDGMEHADAHMGAMEMGAP
jgi:MFS family permease